MGGEEGRGAERHVLNSGYTSDGHAACALHSRARRIKGWHLGRHKKHKKRNGI
jgi:hypothetical protein